MSEKRKKKSCLSVQKKRVYVHVQRGIEFDLIGRTEPIERMMGDESDNIGKKKPP